MLERLSHLPRITLPRLDSNSSSPWRLWSLKLKHRNSWLNREGGGVHVTCCLHGVCRTCEVRGSFCCLYCCTHDSLINAWDITGPPVNGYWMTECHYHLLRWALHFVENCLDSQVAVTSVLMREWMFPLSSSFLPEGFYILLVLYRVLFSTPNSRGSKLCLASSVRTPYLKSLALPWPLPLPSQIRGRVTRCTLWMIEKLEFRNQTPVYHLPITI